MKALKQAVQEHKLPGANLIEKFEAVTAAGYDAIELQSRGGQHLESRMPELKAARAAGVIMPVACIDGAGHPFIGEIDEGRRRQAVNNLKQEISLMCEIGGYGVIAPASYGLYTRNLPPYTAPRTPDEDREILVAALREIGRHAEAAGGYLLFEPLNRYEDSMVNTVGAARDLCEAAGSKGLKVVADAYHMNIEEADMAASLAAVGSYLGEVHLSDSDRYQPGHGHVDWEPLLRTLHQMDFDGYLAVEGRLPEDALAALAESSRLIRGLWRDISLVEK